MPWSCLPCMLISKYRYEMQHFQVFELWLQAPLFAWDKRMCQVLINVYFFVDDDLTLCMKTCWNAVARQFLIHSQHHDIYPVVGSWTKMFTSQRLAFVLYFRILTLSRNFELNDIQKIVILNILPFFIKRFHQYQCPYLYYVSIESIVLLLSEVVPKLLLKQVY